MSSTYIQLNLENTHEALLDGRFATGAATNDGFAWIQATFPYPVPVTSVTIAPLHKNPTVWPPQTGSGGSLQYSHDNQNWTTVGTISYVYMQQQKIETGNITAQYWRLLHTTHLGTSSFIFK
jgi:hypothetical protein